MVIRYLMQVSRYSRQQMIRLITQYRDTDRLVREQRTVRGFSQRFIGADIRLLAQMGERHNTPNWLIRLCPHPSARGTSKE